MRDQIVRIAVASVVGCVLGGAALGGCGAKAAIGGACASSGDCGSRQWCDVSVPGGECTQDCDDDLECGSGNLCAAHNDTACVKACSADSDCRAGFECDGVAAGGKYCIFDDGAADAGVMPDLLQKDVGEPCAADVECGGKLRCDLTVQGGRCTRNCNEDEDCGDEGLCGGAACNPAWSDCATYPVQCVQKCTASECPAGQMCTGSAAAGQYTAGGKYCK